MMYGNIFDVRTIITNFPLNLRKFSILFLTVFITLPLQVMTFLVYDDIINWQVWIYIVQAEYKTTRKGKENIGSII